MGQQIGSALRQSMHRVVLVLANFLPGIAAFLLAVVFFTLIGWGLSVLLRRVLVSVRFDERLASRQPINTNASVADWSPSHSPTLLASRFVFWGCVLIGVAVGLSAFDASYSANSTISIFLLPYVTHITGAVLIVLAGSILARFLARSVLIGAVNAQMQYARFLSLGVKWLVLVLAGAMALDHLQVGGHIVELAFGILFGGIVLTLALAIGLGSRDLVTRSIERNIDRPFVAKPTESQPLTEPEPARSKLRHF
ncbi:hypothetical protein SAMN05421819_1676 [Bryocella elongata]|uniref:Uncharacterized protein n=1 Tax=Bryocella elongata TaxID=863522 RepID=A0A1H5WND9_9BACT|nr:hypothetical protein [Bryocella elongata]SEG01119.1 hypothetical protein SAMN05421819_1676 [Bryocella elongata]